MGQIYLKIHQLEFADFLVFTIRMDVSKIKIYHQFASAAVVCWGCSLRNGTRFSLQRLPQLLLSPLRDSYVVVEMLSSSSTRAREGCK